MIAAVILAIVSTSTGRCFQMPEWFGSSLDHDTLASLSANTNQPLTKDTARAVYSGIDGYYERMAALEPEYFSRQGMTLRKANNVAFGVYSDSVTRDLSGDGLMLKGAAIAEVDHGIRRFVYESDRRFCMPTATSVEAVSDGEWSQNTNLFAQAAEETVKAVYESMADRPVGPDANRSACRNLNAVIDAFNNSEPQFPYLAKPSITNDGQSSSLSGWYFGQWGRECREPSDITYDALVADHHDSRGYLPLMDKVLNDVNPRNCIEVTNQYYRVENKYKIWGYSEGVSEITFTDPFVPNVFTIKNLPSSSHIEPMPTVTQTMTKVSSVFRYGHSYSGSGVFGGIVANALYEIHDVMLFESTITRPRFIVFPAGIITGQVTVYGGDYEHPEVGSGRIVFTPKAKNIETFIVCELTRYIEYWKSDLCAAGKGPPIPTCIGYPVTWLDHYGKLRSLTTVGTYWENHVVTNWSFCAKTIAFGGKPQSEDLLRMAMDYRAAAHNELINVAGGDSWGTWIPISESGARWGYGEIVNTLDAGYLLNFAKYEVLDAYVGKEVGFVVDSGGDGKSDDMYVVERGMNNFPILETKVPDNATFIARCSLEVPIEDDPPFIERMPVEVECAPVVIKQMTRHEWGNYTTTD